VVEADGRERPLERPRDRHFRGTIAGQPAARVFVGIDPDGEVFGLVDRLLGLERIVARRDGSGRVTELSLERIDRAALAAARPFDCQQSRLDPVPD
jgi:hypothetical protein